MTLSFDTICDREQLHTYIAEKLCFPAYYGRNLAALHDCLGDALLAGTKVTLAGTDSIRTALGDYGEKVLDIFAEFGIK
ncbi:MAG: barstar family protein [Muribaculaceae bacterium]|nr:barstar family protein [Roseburia sp.]MCM1431996.1 barstar family protein [Muribaculaceae bacterium]MCM1493750.1 barstar family protein [Muribaculaceae bacterium]